MADTTAVVLPVSTGPGLCPLPLRQLSLKIFTMLRPRLEPPGGTFRCEVLQGFSFLTEDELAAVIREVCWQIRTTIITSLTTRTGLREVPGYCLQPVDLQL